MIRISKCYIRKLSLVLPLTMVLVVNATADPSGLVRASPPLTMARFYIIDSNGRSAPDKNIPMQTVLRDYRSSEARWKQSERRNRHAANKAEKPSDNRDPIRLRLNAPKAWQCELHGFFFTADGRCVQPVIHVKPVAPPMISRRPFRGSLTSK